MVPAFFLLCSFTASAQTSHSTNSASGSNRYLVVVETSRAMQRRSAGTAQALKDLLGSGMHGQMRPGDSLAVWTFNDTLFTGHFPLQEWSTNSAHSVTRSVLKFLESQTYEKQGHLEKVIPSLKSVVRSSEFLMVVLITDGSEDIHGTPYDERINESFKTWATQQQDAKMPFVTVLQAQRGHLTAYAVAPVPWSVELPAMPKPTVAAHSQTAPLAIAPAKPVPSPAVPPLIVSGRKPEKAMIVAPPESAALKQPPLPASMQPETSTPAQAASGPTLAHSTNSFSEPKPGATTLVAKPAELLAPIPRPSQLVETGGSHDKAQTFSRSSTNAEIAATQATAPLSTTDVHTASAQPSLAPESTRPAGDSAPVAIPAPQVALAFPEHAGSNLVLFAASGAFGLTVAGALLWIWKRRARPATHVSLITRSFDREQG